MFQRPCNRHLPAALSVLAAAVLSACGGGDNGSDGAQQFAAQMAQAQAIESKSHALAATTREAVVASVDAKGLMDWAEYKFSSLFSQRLSEFPLPYDGKNFTVRAYGGGRYLGVTDTGAIYGLGDFTNNQLQGFGSIPDWSSQVIADSCSVYPGSCNPGGGGSGSGQVNECAMNSSTLLATGTTLHAVYAHTGTLSGDSTTDSTVEGPKTFEGNNAIAVLTTTSGVLASGTGSTTGTVQIRAYEQVAAGGLTTTFGSELSTGPTSFKTVYTPPTLNTEFSIGVGQSISVTATSTTSFVGLPVPGTTSTLTTNHTYEARETVNVLGKSYDTCRYKSTIAKTPNVVTTTWYIVGYGVPAKIIEATNGTTTSTQELKTATVNGRTL